MEALRRRLQRATEEEKKQLAKDLEASSISETDLIAALRKQSKSVIERWFGNELSYREILMKVLASQNQSHRFGVNSSIEALESCIAEVAFNKHRDSLTPEARAKFDLDLNETRAKLMADKMGFGSLAGGLLAAQLAAQVSGFGIYMMASSTLASITHLVGLTLPFAAFTGMASTIALMIGPIGIAFSGLVLLIQLFRNDMGRSTTAIFTLNGIRHRTGSTLRIAVGHEDPRCWFLPLESCQSLGQAKQLLADLNEHQSNLTMYSGYRFIAWVAESLDASVTSGDELSDQIAAIRPLRNSKQKGDMVERVVAQFERLRPERVAEILCRISESIPNAMAACYAAAPQDGEMHYASTMLLALQAANV